MVYICSHIDIGYICKPFLLLMSWVLGNVVQVANVAICPICKFVNLFVVFISIMSFYPMEAYSC